MTKIDHTTRNAKERGQKSYDYQKVAEEAVKQLKADLRDLERRVRERKHLPKRASKVKVYTPEERDAFVKDRESK